MSSKEKYQKFCESGQTVPVYSLPWWLDAVCGPENWDVLIDDAGGEVRGALPFYKTNRYGFFGISQPPLTQNNGVLIHYPLKQKYSKKLAYEKKIMQSLITQLEDQKPAFFDQNFDYRYSNWLPFYWNGFQQTTRYTYILYPSSMDDVYSGCETKIRTDIKKADKKVNVLENLNIEEFYRINTMTFERQNMAIPYSLDFIKKIDQAGRENNSSKNLYAIDAEGNIHGVIYLIWDENSVYYLLSGGNPEYRNSGANALLLWKAIEEAFSGGKEFNFEGSMMEPVERFYRGFGAQQKAYHRITKVWNPFYSIMEQGKIWAKRYLLQRKIV